MTVMGARRRQSRKGPVCYSTFARSSTNTEMKTLRRLTSVAGHCSSTDLLHAWFENAFSKLKALLRAKAERTISALWNAVGPILDLFTPAECANYFKAAGYDPD
jgi:hypothetical protein